jgi:uncharacterized protein (TIGR00251 family)
VNEVDTLREKLRRDGQVTFQVKITPKSSRNSVAGAMEDGTLRLKIAAVPEKGKANAEICVFLGELFGVAKTNVEIVRGHTGSVKLVAVKA